MKRIYYIPLLFLLASCKKENDATPLTQYLDFKTQLIDTKGVVKSQFVIGDQFFIYGVINESGEYSAAAPKADGHIFNEPAAKGVPVMNNGKDSEGGDVWKYNKPVVWSPGKSTFFAFSPVPNHAENFGITPLPNGFALNELPSINFTVAGGYDQTTATQSEIVASREYNRKQVDLLVAYTPNLKAGKQVNLAFEHTLAQITFAVRPMQKTGFIRLNSVTMKNVATTAKLNLANTADPNAIDFTGGWVQASLENTKSFSINLRHDVASLIPATPDKVYEINDADETLMMIPQKLENITLNIKYSYSTDGITWPDYQAGKEVNVALSTISSHWKPNKQYKYILTVEPENTSKVITKISNFNN